MCKFEVKFDSTAICFESDAQCDNLTNVCNQSNTYKTLRLTVILISTDIHIQTGKQINDMQKEIDTDIQKLLH